MIDAVARREAIRGGVSGHVLLKKIKHHHRLCPRARMGKRPALSSAPRSAYNALGLSNGAHFAQLMRTSCKFHFSNTFYVPFRVALARGWNKPTLSST